MKILLLTAFYLPGYKGGGPVKTTKNLINELGDKLDFNVLTSDHDLGENSSYKGIKHGQWNNVGKAKVFYLDSSLLGYKQVFRFIKSNEYDVIYLNSLFSFRYSIFPYVISLLFRKEVIIAPRGELSPGALEIKALKKKVFLSILKTFRMHDKAIYQASTQFEKIDIQNALGTSVDILIVENIATNEFADKLESNPHEKRAVFISRISPKKNLYLALEILKKVRKPLVYDIYGPIEDESYWQKCQSIITNLPSNVTVRYKGELTPEQVVPKLSSYDFFFMPTKGENYGHVIVEALCAALPLVISDTTPWRNLENLGIGWDLPLDNMDAFSKVIDQIIEMSNDQHLKMRKSVLKWAKQRFTQHDSIEANISMFDYALNKKKGINNAIQK